MATQEQIEALKIDENVFELAEDTELEYLVHFAAPFTGGDIRTTFTYARRCTVYASGR